MNLSSRSSGPLRLALRAIRGNPIFFVTGTITEYLDSRGSRVCTRTLQKWDWMTGLVAALVSFAVYAWSAAPNVTLLDSGEFLVAAQHFGVPHPTGYPLWTLLNWLFRSSPPRQRRMGGCNL